MRTISAAALVSMAVLLYCGPAVGRGLVLARSRDIRFSTRSMPTAVAVVAAAVCSVLALQGGFAGTVVVAGAGCVAAAVAWLVRVRRAEMARRRRQDAVVGLCDALAAELYAGLAAQTALARACADWVEFAPIKRVAQLGGELTGAFSSLADQSGFEGLRAIAAGWRVAERSGASLGSVLDRIGDGLRAQCAARAEIESALEPPRATARMLAVLPVFGVLLGTAMGAEPLDFLLGTSAGRICLLSGLLLAVAGVAWVERLARSESPG